MSLPAVESPGPTTNSDVLHGPLLQVDASGYLNTAAEGLFLPSHQVALERYASLKAKGSAGREGLEQMRARTATLAADMLSVKPEDVTFVASTSRGLDMAIKSIPWERGDNLVFADTEFPTIGFAAALLAENGVEARVVPSVNGVVTIDAYGSRIDRRTRLVVASVVSYKSGQALDLETLCTVAHAQGALVFADAVQAVGAIEVAAGNTDFLSAGTFKWLAAAHGLGLLYVNPAVWEELQPPYVAYRGVIDLFAHDRFEAYHLRRDARRLDEGMPNYLGVSVLESSLVQLGALGMPRVSGYNRALVARLNDGLSELQIRTLGPDENTSRGSITAFETNAEFQIGRSLAAMGTTVWAKDGRVRLSPHVYNTLEDIDRVLQQLAEIEIGGAPVAATQPHALQGGRS